MGLLPDSEWPRILVVCLLKINGVDVKKLFYKIKQFSG